MLLSLFFVSVMLGATYENNMLFLFAFVLLTFLFIAILVTAAEIQSVQVESFDVQSGFPGERSQINVLFHNASATNIQFSAFAEKKQQQVIEIEPRLSKVVALNFTLPAKRGQHQIERLRMYTQGPLLFFNCWKYWYIHADYFVYPKAQGQALPTRPQGMELANVSGLDEYSGREALSRISWRHFGRSGKLMVKTAESESLDQYEFRLSSLAHLETEASLSQLSLWIKEAENLGLSYSLYLKAFQSKVAKGRGHQQKLMEKLAVFKDD